MGAEKNREVDKSRKSSKRFTERHVQRLKCSRRELKSKLAFLSDSAIY